MNTHKPSRIDRRTAEHLLGQVQAGVRTGHPPLAALLAAAAVPGRPEELAREQSVVTAFRTAPTIPAPHSGRLSVIKSAVAKVLTVKVMTILGATAAGGVALAATTGALPNPLTSPSPSASAGLSAAADASASAAAHRSAEAEASKGADAKDASASHAPSPSLVGLCHAYSVGNKTEQGKALESAAFSVLVTTAGGKDKVAQYCTTLLASASPDKSAAADNAKSSTDHPTARPSSEPSEADHAVRPSASAKH